MSIQLAPFLGYSSLSMKFSVFNLLEPKMLDVNLSRHRPTLPEVTLRPLEEATSV